MKSVEVSLEGQPNEPGVPPEYVEAIKKAKKRYPNLLQEMSTTPCFVQLWQDADGVCPNDGTNGTKRCIIRQQCQAGFESVHQEPAKKSPPAETKPAKVVVKKAKKKESVPVTEDKPLTSRGKWRGTGKYQRNGYVAVGRPVDQALEHLVNALENPQCLPPGWSPNHFHEKYGHLGRLVLSQTSSYTSVIVDGQTVLRFWTNAGTCALIDIIPEMIKVVKTIEGVPEIIPVLEGSAKKLRPCTHRFELTFGANTHEKTLTVIGAMIRMAYTKP